MGPSLICKSITQMIRKSPIRASGNSLPSSRGSGSEHFDGEWLRFLYLQFVGYGDAMVR